jgi:hypothetical protein
MRRVISKPAGEAASKYRPQPGLPPARRLWNFASACHDLAERETDSARRRLFREMESAWKAVAAQVERTDELMGKLRTNQCQTLN